METSSMLMLLMMMDRDALLHSCGGENSIRSPIMLQPIAVPVCIAHTHEALLDI